ncbi:MAG: PP2C family serine/threonine-protein phosphatase [Bacilli bacterium]
MIEKGYGASLIGKSHIKIKKPSQDSYLISNMDNYTLVVVCDGLGSKKYSHIGSKKLCKVIDKQIKLCFKHKNLDMDTLIPIIKNKWKRFIWPIKPNKADTTCIFAVVNKKNIILCQIGDGLCAIKIDNNLVLLSEKDDDFSNETISFYKGNIRNWNIKILKKEENVNYKVFICTDGVSEDLKKDVIKEFIEELAQSIDCSSNYKDNSVLLDVIKNWPNKYSNDDKTMVVIK